MQEADEAEDVLEGQPLHAAVSLRRQGAGQRVHEGGEPLAQLARHVAHSAAPLPSAVSNSGHVWHPPHAHGRT